MTTRLVATGTPHELATVIRCSIDDAEPIGAADIRTRPPSPTTSLPSP
jgi:hypothetical protein